MRSATGTRFSSCSTTGRRRHEIAPGFCSGSPLRARHAVWGSSRPAPAVGSCSRGRPGTLADRPRGGQPVRGTVDPRVLLGNRRSRRLDRLRSRPARAGRQDSLGGDRIGEPLGRIHGRRRPRRRHGGRRSARALHFRRWRIRQRPLSPCPPRRRAAGPERALLLFALSLVAPHPSVAPSLRLAQPAAAAAEVNWRLPEWLSSPLASPAR